VVAVLAATMVLRPAQVLADDAAEEMLRRGLVELEAKHTAAARELLDRACPLLNKKYHDDPRPRTLYDLAICEEARDRYATAAAHYDEYFSILDRLSGDERRVEMTRQADAARRRQAIEPFIPTVVLVLPTDAPAETRALRFPDDGSPPVSISVGVPLRLDPGEHVVSTQAGADGPRTDTKFSVRKGEKNKKIELKWSVGDSSSRVVQPGVKRGPIDPDLPPIDPPISAWRIGAYSMGAAGIAGLLLGIVSGAVTWAQKGRVSSNCEANPMVGKSMAVLPQVCNPDGESGANTARTWGAVSTPAFVAGGALLGLGIILYVTEPTPARLQQQGGLRLPSLAVKGIDYGGATFDATWTF
jgi:hypothetical protein